MPRIEIAMQWSRRRGLGEILMNNLWLRDVAGVTNEVSGVQNTFSSWNNCMQKSYCKWPVIIAIVAVSLMVLSIVSCIIRCACCGMSCCCSCFNFLNCCCGGCCEGKKQSGPRRDDQINPSLNGNGYSRTMPMMSGAAYAQFEVGENGLAIDKKRVLVSEDALPPMPSWDSASKKHVLVDQKNDVELGDLDPTTGQKVPLMSGANGGVVSPPSPSFEPSTSPYGPRPGQGVNGNGYMGVPNNDSSFNSPGYRGSPGPGISTPMGSSFRGYGSPSPPMGMPPSDAFPSQVNRNDGFIGTNVGGGRPPMFNQYASTNDSVPNQSYPSQPTRQYSGSPSRHPYSDTYSNNSFPTGNGYQSGPPRGPSRGPPLGPMRMPSPANSGFDFGLGEQTSRQPSPQQGYNSGGYRGPPGPPSYATNTPPAPAPQQPLTAAYPGYRPYQMQKTDSGSEFTPRGLMPRNSNEPQAWDPVRR